MPLNFWVQRQDIGPSPRADFEMAYHGESDRVILFGGDARGGSPLADTWSWDGSLWTQVADTGPSARSGHTLVKTPDQQRLVLFGGRDGAGFKADTWAFDGTDWTQVEDVGPSPREGHAAAYDVARGALVLFGGDAGGTLQNDTWTWDGVAWTQVQDTGPSPRRGHAMAFDAPGQRVILFGGVDGAEAGLDDTWAWNGSSWTQVADTGPEPRADLSLTANAASLVLFGGISSLDENATPAPIVYGDTWEWTAQGWSKIQDIGPAARHGHGAAVRTQASRLVLFGGSRLSASPGSPAPSDDTWELPVQTSGGNLAITLESAFVNPPILSIMTPMGSMIAAVEVSMNMPPPAGQGVQVSLLTTQGGVFMPAPGMVVQPASFDGQSLSLSVPIVNVGPLVAGGYEANVMYGGQSIIAPFQVQ